MKWSCEVCDCALDVLTSLETLVTASDFGGDPGSIKVALLGSSLIVIYITVPLSMLSGVRAGCTIKAQIILDGLELLCGIRITPYPSF